MEHLTGKVLRRIEEMGVSQSRAAEAAGVDSARFSRILKGQGKLSVEQLFALSRFLSLPMDYLADPGMHEPPGEQGLSQAQRTVVKIFDALHLSEEEAIRRLTAGPSEPNSGEGQNRKPGT